MRFDGYLALSYNNLKRIVWKTNTNRLGERLVMQTNGDLVVFDEEDQVVWQSSTQGRGEYAVLQDNANLVIFDSSGKEAWSTGTSLG